MATKSRVVAELVTPGRLDKPLVVLRRVNVAPLSVKVHKNAPSIMDRISGGYIEQGVEERETVWFNDGLVLNDQPRLSIVTEEIMENTIDFAVARTDTGEILRDNLATLAEAQALVDGARIELNVGVEIAQEELDADAAEDIAIAEAEAEAAAQEEAEAAAAEAESANS